MDSTILSAIIGAGATILVAVLGLARAHKRRPKHPAITADDRASPILPPASLAAVDEQRLLVREQRPQDIWDVLLAALPLQRQQAYSTAYAGRWVRWSATVNNVHHASNSDGFTASLESSIDNRRFVFMGLELPISERPTVETLRSGDTILFEGRLKSWSTDTVNGFFYLHNGHILSVTPPADAEK